VRKQRCSSQYREAFALVEAVFDGNRCPLILGLLGDVKGTLTALLSKIGMMASRS